MSEVREWLKGIGLGQYAEALAANDFSNVLWIKPQLIDCRPFPLDRRNGYFVGVLDQPFDGVFEEGLHGIMLKPPRAQQPLWSPF